jgi:hypothetical protein
VQVSLSRRLANIATAAGFIIGSIYFSFVSYDFPAGGELFPLFLFACICALSLLLIIEQILKTYNEDDKLVSIQIDFVTWKPLFVTATVILHVILIFLLGYFTSSIIFLIACSFLIGLRSVRAICTTIIVLFPLMYAFFELFLKANLPTGLLI